MVTPHTFPHSQIDLWDDFHQEIEAEAEKYKENGWETHIFTVGEVRPSQDSEVTGNPNGPALRTLLPDNHFETLSDLIDEGKEYTCKTYRESVREEIVLLLLVYIFEYDEVAIFIPLFYRQDEAKPMIESAEAEGRLITEFHPLDKSETLSLEHTNPSMFLPDRQ